MMTQISSNLPKLSNRALRALDVLADGGCFQYRLERNSYTGREQFQYRLKAANGMAVRGVSFAAFHELRDAGFLEQRHEATTSVSTTFKLAAA